MPDWPAITEPKLRARLGLGDEEFFAFMLKLLSALGRREFSDTVYERALGYPWERPAQSYRLTGAEVELLDALPEPDGEPRFPLLAFGSNGSPGRLIEKFGALPPQERKVVVITGSLHDFDVGVSPLPTVYGALPATIFPSAGTAVRAALLLVTARQLETLVWTEVSYFYGRLDGVRFDLELPGAEPVDHVLAFASRLGARCVDGEPVALAAVPAEGRRATALTQLELLGLSAREALGDAATARDLVERVITDYSTTIAEIAPALRGKGQPFASPRWTRFPVA